MVKQFILVAFLLPRLLLAQIWDFSGVEKLPANINTEAEEIAPLVTPDGKTLYFARILYPQNEGGKFSGSDIWMSNLSGKDTWGKAAAGGNFNDRGNNAIVGIKGDGNNLYLLKTTGATKPSGLHVSKRSGSQWSRPELIPIENFDPKGFLGFYVSPDYDVIFISMKADDSKGEEDIYVSSRNTSGQWTKPKNLGSSVNTKGFEISPFLSADKRRLYFSSNGHKGLGDADIFYCDRLYESWDTWTAPRNLGEKLNSKNFDAYFSMYGDSVAYFSSNRGGKYADIYKAKVFPGNEVLAFGQSYLTSEEVRKIVGNVSRKISFEKDVVMLTPQQKELLFYIANKLNNHREVNLHISIIEENNPDLTTQRLDAIGYHLRESGIENLRLLLTNTGMKIKNDERSTFEILLYK